MNKYNILFEDDSNREVTNESPASLVLSETFVRELNSEYRDWYPTSQDVIKGLKGQTWEYRDIPESEIVEILTFNDLD